MHLFHVTRILAVFTVGVLILIDMAANAADVAIYEFAGNSTASTDLDGSTTAGAWIQTVGVITGDRVRADGLEVPNSLSASIFNNLYGGFTFNTNGNTSDLTQLTVDYGSENAFGFVLSVFASTDGGTTGFNLGDQLFTINNMPNVGVSSPPTIQNVTNVLDLGGLSSLQSLNGSIEFRFYLHDGSSTGSRVHLLDNIRLTALASTVNDQKWILNASGDWNAAGNWDPAGVPGSGTSVVLGDVITADRTVTLDTNVNLNRLTFSSNSGGYSITPEVSQTLTLSSSAEVRAVGSGIHTIGARILGSNGLVKTGSGTVTLTNINNGYTGTTDVQGGTLGATSPGAVTGAINIGSSAMFAFRGDEAGGGYDGVFSNALTGTGTVLISNTLTTETVTFNAPKSFAGTVQINGGTLSVTNSGALGTGETNASRTAIQGGSSSGKLALSGNITVASELLTLDGRNTGNVHITSAGNNSWNGNIDARGTGAQLNIESTSGTLALGGILAAPDGNANQKTLVFSGAGNTTITGMITDDAIDDIDNNTRTASQTNNVNVLKRGSGILTMSTQSADVADYHRGTTVVEQGTLRVTAGVGNVGELSSTRVTVNADAELDLTSFGTYNMQAESSLGVVQEFGGSGTINANTFGYFDDNSLSPGDSTGTLTLNGNLSMSTFTAAPLGALKYELSNVNTIGGGVNDLITVNGSLTANTSGGGKFNVAVVPVTGGLATGTYRLMNYTGTLLGNVTSSDFLAGLVDTTGAPIGNTRQTLAVSTTTAGQVNLIVSGVAKNLTWTGPGNWDIATSSNWNSGADQFFNLDSVTFNDLGGSNNVNIASAVLPAAVTFSGTNTYTFTGAGIVGSPTFNVNSGTVILNNNGNQFSGTVTIASGATLQFGNGTSNASRVPDGDTPYIVNGTLVVNESAGNEAINGIISGNGVVRVDSSTVVLSGNNSFTGAISAADGATIGIDNTETGTPLGSATTGTTLGLGATLQANGQTGTVAEPLTLNGGILSVGGGSSSALTWSGPITVGAGDTDHIAELRLGNGTDTTSTNGLTVSGDIAGTGGEAIRFRVDPGSTTVVTGNIQHNGALLKDSAGRLELRGSNNHIGDTVIADGTIALVGSSSLDNSPIVQIQSLGKLDASGSSGGIYLIPNGQILDNDGLVVGNIVAESGSTLTIGGNGSKQFVQQEVTINPPLGGGISTMSDVRTASGTSANSAQNDTADNAMGSLNATNSFRTLLSFDLSEIGITNPNFIDEVNLSMQLTGPNGAQVNTPVAPTLELHRLATGYDSSTVTFNTQPDFNNVIASVTGPNFAAGNYTAGRIIAWNQATSGALVDAVKDSLGSSIFLGAKVDDTSEAVATRSFYFVYSAEDGALAPKLSIKYTDTTSPQVLGIGTGTIEGDFVMNAGSRLEFDIFDTSTFDQLDITGSLTAGGTLAVNLLGTPQAGDSYNILDFASLSAGSFTFDLPSPGAGLTWDTSDLLVNGALGVVTAVGLPGDFDFDGDVDGRDFLVWQRGGSPNGINSGDLVLWQNHYGNQMLAANTAIPEPTALVLIGFGLLTVAAGRRRS